MPAARPKPGPWLPLDEAAKFAGVEVRTFERHLRDREEIARRWVGAVCVYSSVDIDTYLRVDAPHANPSRRIAPHERAAVPA